MTYQTRGDGAFNTKTSVTPIVKFKCRKYFSLRKRTMWWTCQKTVYKNVCVFADRTNLWVMVSPINRCLQYDDDTTFVERLRANSDNLLPPECRHNFFNGITLCKLGSIFLQFSFCNAEGNCREIMPCQHFLVYDVSQVSDADIFPLLSSIAFAQQEYKQTWSLISFLGDPYQLPLNTRAQRPPCY